MIVLNHIASSRRLLGMVFPLLFISSLWPACGWENAGERTRVLADEPRNPVNAPSGSVIYSDYEGDLVVPQSATLVGLIEPDKYQWRASFDF